MASEISSSFQHRSLRQQGYQQFTPQQLTELEWGLRFTPTACALMALYGLIAQQPWVLYAVAVLGVWAFLAPAAHPMDLLYNHLIRPLFRAAPLPPNPLQRRLACLSAAGMNLVAGTLLLFGWTKTAYVVGGCLLVLQAIVIATHFCLLSWVYEGAARMLGRWNLPVDPEKAQQLLRSGATVIDVRTPQEFADRHLDCAVNFPLENLANQLERLPRGALLVHCKSGMRSNMATRLLQSKGIKNVHNLGSFDRARSIVEVA